MPHTVWHCTEGNRGIQWDGMGVMDAGLVSQELFCLRFLNHIIKIQIPLWLHLWTFLSADYTRITLHELPVVKSLLMLWRCGFVLCCIADFFIFKFHIFVNILLLNVSFHMQMQMHMCQMPMFFGSLFAQIVLLTLVSSDKRVIYYLHYLSIFRVVHFVLTFSTMNHTRKPSYLLLFHYFIAGENIKL